MKVFFLAPSLFGSQFWLDLPEVSAEGLDIDLEDEFSFLSAEDNGERIKALEKEKAELTLQLKRLVEVQVLLIRHSLLLHSGLRLGSCRGRLSLCSAALEKT